MQNYKETPFDLMVIDAFIAAKSLTITDKARVIIGRYMQAHFADENNPRIPKLLHACKPSMQRQRWKKTKTTNKLCFLRPPKVLACKNLFCFEVQDL